MTGSYWQREAGWCDRWQDGSLPSSADFAILGGGLAGLTTAIRLRELHPGAEVVLLEAERVGYGASGRNAGFLSPLAAPVWLLGARSADQAWAAARINAEVHDTARWLAGSIPESQIHPTNLSLEATGTLSEVGLGELARALDDVALAYRLSESRTRPGRLALEMDAYSVHPYRLVRGLAEHASRAGVRIHERARVRAVEAAHGGARVRLDGGAALFARKVIVCTNGYTSTLDVGERIRALVVHSFMLASVPLDRPVLGGIVRDGAFTVELNLDQAFHRLHDNRILFGGMDKVLAPPGDDFDAPASVQSRLVRLLRDSYPRLAGITAAQAWGGRFHATASGLPIIRE